MNQRELHICAQRTAILECASHMLVLGGPGSGKTTIALVKAAVDLNHGILAASQKILFLSFARATVSRVMAEAASRIPKNSHAFVEINTYHGFAWSFIQTHSYLLTGRRPLRLLSPPEASSRLAGVPKDERPARLRELFEREGLLGFDLFAGLLADLLEQSDRLCTTLSDCYPTIALDEFQDTNSDEWRIIKALGRCSRLIALADAEQRIYEFRGADPARIGEFIEHFNPEVFDFGTENNRSDGTDIIQFGNELLTGANRGKTYAHVKIQTYNAFLPESFNCVKYAVFDSMRRLVSLGPGAWSLAVLVSSKDMMLKLSAFMESTGRADSIVHEALLDPEGPSLAAVLIAGVLAGAATFDGIERGIAADLVNHIRGRGGGDISQANLKLAGALEQYAETGQIRGAKRQELIRNVRFIAMKRDSAQFTGDPGEDWLTVRSWLDECTHEALADLARDARYVRLLNRGTQLRQSLAAQWRSSGNYNGARQTVSGALLQEHFSNSTRVWRGVNLMTIHKSKGKDFDEVIIFEGMHMGRLLRQNASPREVEQAKLALRVGVTRARQRTVILTPRSAICKLL